MKPNTKMLNAIVIYDPANIICQKDIDISFLTAKEIS